MVAPLALFLGSALGAGLLERSQAQAKARKEGQRFNQLENILSPVENIRTDSTQTGPRLRIDPSALPESQRGGLLLSDDVINLPAQTKRRTFLTSDNYPINVPYEQGKMLLGMTPRERREKFFPQTTNLMDAARLGDTKALEAAEEIAQARLLQEQNRYRKLPLDKTKLSEGDKVVGRFQVLEEQRENLINQLSKTQRGTEEYRRIKEKIKFVEAKMASPQYGGLPATLLGASPQEKAIIKSIFGGSRIQDTRTRIATVQNDLGKLDDIIGALEDPEQTIGGVARGFLTEKAPPLAALIYPESLDAFNTITSIVFKTLKDTLGSQFTEREGRLLVQAAYNPYLSDKQNAVRLKRMQKEIIAIAQLETQQLQNILTGGVENLTAEELLGIKGFDVKEFITNNIYRIEDYYDEDGQSLSGEQLAKIFAVDEKYAKLKNQDEFLDEVGKLNVAEFFENLSLAGENRNRRIALEDAEDLERNYMVENLTDSQIKSMYGFLNKNDKKFVRQNRDIDFEESDNNNASDNNNNKSENVFNTTIGNYRFTGGPGE